MGGRAVRGLNGGRRGAYVYDLPGLVPYDDGLALQRNLAAARSQRAIPDVLVLLEHEPVLTVGPRTDEAAELPSADALAAAGIAVRQTDRGGAATYHGPGQLVGYPILDLTGHGRDLRAYVRALQDGLVGALEELGIGAGTREGREHVGVWVGAPGAERKIASIGIHVRRWIATHGFALNVDPDLDAFRLFTPCGLRGVEMTSVSRELGRTVDRAEATAAVLAGLGRALELSWEPVPVAAWAGA